MFLNERPIPITLQQLIVARSRLHNFHPKQQILEKSELKSWAGYHGERQVDKYLEKFANDQFTIFRDLNLAVPDPFQIDSFLYNLRYGLILEIKNILGNLFFDKYSNQMIRTYKGEREGFANPIIQAQMQQYNLQKWFQKHKIPPIPIVWLVVFSNPATILETNPGNEHIFQKVIHANSLPAKLMELESKYNSEKMDMTTLKKINRLLVRENTPFLKNILQKHDISKSDSKTGVRCPICDYVPMVRVSAKWHCPICKNDSKTAHIHSLYDYLLLHQPTMTNQECRDFLHITSRKMAQGVLSDLPMIGTNKYCSHQLSKLLQDPTTNFLLPKSKQWD